MVNDVMSDTLARLQNAVMRKKENVLVYDVKMVSELLRILKEEGFVMEYAPSEDGMVTVELSYDESGEPVVKNFTRVSKPGQRMYVTKKEIKPVVNGRGISVVSTSKGLMTGARAKANLLGGEYICKVW